MQFVEVSDLSVRAAAYQMVRPDSQLRFTLFPMIHVGEPGYFAAVYKRLTSCDLILIEGIESRKVTLLTRSYRWVDQVRRLGLVTQQSAKLIPPTARVIRTDLDGRDFDAGWKKLPFWERALVSLTIPIFAGYMMLHGTKDLIARNLAMEDLPSREEMMLSGALKIESLIMDQRDAVLLGHVQWVHDEHQHHDMTVAVVYGASHLRAVTTYLSRKLGYHVAKADWLTVFRF